MTTAAIVSAVLILYVVLPSRGGRSVRNAFKPGYKPPPPPAPPAKRKEHPLMSDTPLLDIEYQREGHCLWHTNCPENAHHSGIMRVERNELERSLVKCMHCGQHAYFPVGGVCVSVPKVEVS